MDPPKLQQQRYQEPGTGWGDGSGISYSNGPRWWVGDGVMSVSSGGPRGGGGGGGGVAGRIP